MTHHETRKHTAPTTTPTTRARTPRKLHGDALALLRELPTHSDYPLILHGDCVEEMRQLPEASVHAVVTDPPYGINFMGKAWDAPMAACWARWQPVTSSAAQITTTPHLVRGVKRGSPNACAS